MLFGREVELGHVDAVVRAARESGPAVLVLRGEPGIGKSALLRHAFEVGQDLHVVSARAVETESGLPFAFVSALARPLMTYVGELPATQSRCLRAALGEDESGTTDVFLLGAALLALFAEASREQPLLLLLDDVHWADEVSLRAVVFALLRLDRDPVGAILTLRDVDVPSMDSSGFLRINPARLDVAAATSLIAAVRGEQPPAGVAAELAEATGGNPLALVELAGSLDGAAFSARSGLPAPLPIGEKLLNVYGQRVQLLPLETQRALLVAAASDERTGPILQALAALGGSRNDLDAAERAGLIALSDTITFRHPLIRAAVIGSADPADRRSVHRALSGVALSVESQAWHLAAASVGPDDTAAAALATAAGSAANRGDPASAAEMWARAADLTSEAEQRAPLLADAAEAADSAGRFERCRVLAAAGLRAAPEPFVRGRLLRLVAQFDEPEQSHALLLEAASLLAPQDSLAEMRALGEAVWAGLAIRSVDLVRQAVDRALALDRSTDARTTLLRACLVGYGLAITGDLVSALPHFDFAITAIRQNRSLRDDPVALGDAIEVPGFFGRVDVTHDFVEHGLRSARASGAVSLLPRLVAERACVATWRAEWARATALTAEAADLYRAMGYGPGSSSSPNLLDL